MDFGFLASANSITSKYLEQNIVNKVASENSLSDSVKEKFGTELEDAYDSMMATKMLSANLRQNYEISHADDFRAHASRLGYSIDNRVIDMLHIQINDNMNQKINNAMDNAIHSIV